MYTKALRKPAGPTGKGAAPAKPAISGGVKRGRNASDWAPKKKSKDELEAEDALVVHYSEEHPWWVAAGVSGW